MRNRNIETQSRNLKMIADPPVIRSDEADLDFAKMRVGVKSVEDANMIVSSFAKVNKKLGNKEEILKALSNKDLNTLRDISEFYYDTNGIYRKMCEYLAFLYHYDWLVTPYVKKNSAKPDSILTAFSNALNYLDKSQIKKMCGQVALEVVRGGSYYGYVLDHGDYFSIQQLPARYCRTRFNSGLDPVVELNMKFFDDYFKNIQYRLKVLTMFPKEIQKGYVLYQEKKLVGDYPGDETGWFVLNPKLTVKFNLHGSDYPALVNAIPSIIDLDAAQELDRKKTMQQLLKIIIQKLPLDKNGDLIFDMDEARDIHNNAVAMLKRAVGIDVLTTFADIDSIDAHDKNSATSSDDLEKVERTVFNNLGTSQNLFNTDGNLSLEKSIANDEADMRDLLLQFEGFLNRLVEEKFSKAQFEIKVNMLETTIYNYKEMAKLYKEQTQIGYSKFLPQIALGHSQSYVLASLHFENDVLNLAEKMIPPQMSSTMSGKAQDKETGRPPKQDDEKSEKTIQNEESKS